MDIIKIEPLTNTNGCTDWLQLATPPRFIIIIKINLITIPNGCMDWIQMAMSRDITNTNGHTLNALFFQICDKV